MVKIIKAEVVVNGFMILIQGNGIGLKCAIRSILNAENKKKNVNVNLKDYEERKNIFVLNFSKFVYQC